MILEHRVLKVPKEYKVILESKGCKAQLAHKVNKGHKERLASKVCKAQLVFREILVKKVWLVNKARKDYKVILVYKEYRV